MRLAGFRAFDSPELALPDQPLAKVRIEAEVVGAEESGEGGFVACLSFHTSSMARMEECVWSNWRESTVSPSCKP